MRPSPSPVRSISAPTRACVVCGASDERHLTRTRLATGEDAVVCGNHELGHRRSSKTAATVQELRNLVGDRRERDERRGAIEGDELALQLTEAFTGERRAVSERRR